MKKAFLVIGEKKRIKGQSIDPCYNAFTQYLKNDTKLDAQIWKVVYKDVLNRKLPKIINFHLTILLFFPFQYWNKNIEIYDKDARIYGDIKFGRKFEQFFKKLEVIIKKAYPNKKIEYVNPPMTSVLDRDKQSCKSYLLKHNIPLPKSFHVKTVADIERLAAKGISMYIKPRFGSMGKGISYISNGLLMTNFLFQKGKIISHQYDYHWRFHEINKPTDRKKLLKTLLVKGFIFEEAIDPPINKGRRSDFRVYCIYGKIPYFYVRSTPVVSLVTNWSQGGKIEQKKMFSKYISEAKLKKVKSLAIKTAKTLKMNYAGIDIIFSKDYKQIYVLEAHSFPGFEKGFNLMKKLANVIQKRCLIS